MYKVCYPFFTYNFLLSTIACGHHLNKSSIRIVIGKVELLDDVMSDLCLTLAPAFHYGPSDLLR